MAVPVVASSSSTTFATGVTSLVITKPTGLAVGDLLIGAVFFTSGTGTPTTVTPPADWTTLQTVDTNNTDNRMYVFYRIATSTETAASNFTFTLNTAATAGGGLLRITGVASGNEIQTSEQDVYNSTSSTAISFTSTITPNWADTLVLAFLAAFQSGSGTGTVASYTSTPSKSWTEIFELANTQGTDNTLVAATATAGVVATQITQYGATLAVAKNIHAGVIVAITPPQNPTVTNALFEISPAIIAPTLQSSSVVTADFIEVSPDISAQSARAKSPTQWTNESTVSTAWTNEQGL